MSEAVEPTPAPGEGGTGEAPAPSTDDLSTGAAPTAASADAPSADVLAADSSEADVPAADSSAADVSAADVPPADAPATDGPAVDSPPADPGAGTTDAPSAQAEATGPSGTDVADVSYLTSTSPGRGARTAPRSWLHGDAPTLSLDGEWRFRLLPAVPGTAGAGGVLPAGEGPTDFADPGYDDSGWESITLPTHWVLRPDGAWGRPIYTNVQLPIPLDPPNVPDENPTGDHRLALDVPAGWTDGSERVLLRFDGVESTYRVWVNGAEVGVSTGSRLATEFDVTAHVRAGETNTVAVRVHQWSAATYLEDQDQWWLPGIFRDVTLVARPAAGITDLWLRAGYSGPVAGSGAGTLEVELDARPEAFPVTLSIAELDVHRTWESPEDVAPVELAEVEPWSAERPRLYEAVVSNAAETITQRVGFRTVSIEDGVLLVNGTRVLFHGVNRHETHPEQGRVFDEAHARADMALMKRFNVNAIRTSHYPPHPRVLDLADELGFWVVDECDLETHAFGSQDWAQNPSDDPAWREAYLERITKTVERDKNHACVVMWSLGNEAGTGENLAAMAGWVHHRDPSRPVHYEGDYTGQYTDVYSRMYSSIPETTAIGTDGDLSPLLGCTSTEGARQRTKPFILCEYVHAMGNGPGAIDQYEELFQNHPRLQGGFVWEWRDHGLWHTTPVAPDGSGGTRFLAYGGDFGEVVHDGNFVMDGLVLSDDTPSPGLHEYAAVVQPLRLAWSANRLTVDNLRHSTDTSDLRLRWRVEVEGDVVTRGTVKVPTVQPGKSSRITLDPGTPALDGEAWLTVEAELLEATAWAPSGHVVARGQFPLAPASQRPIALFDPGPAVLPARSTVPARLELGPAVLEHGVLTSLAGLPVSGPRPELWRAPTDNDRGKSFGSYADVDPWAEPKGRQAPSAEQTWRSQGLHRLVHRVVAVEAGEDRLVTRGVSMAANGRARLTCTTSYRLVRTEQGERLAVSVQLVPSRGWPSTWPRLGVRLDLPAEVDGAEWFGLGPNESYPDSRRAALVGTWALGVDELATPYSRPQETGHRSGLRRLSLTRAGRPVLELEAVADEQGRRPGFTLSRFTAQQLSEAAHPHELAQGEHTHLYLDAAQHGLGSRACGPDVWPTHALRPEARTLRFLV
ncbi:glycoside hydrolase family 2 TIM barrel-domain containing protein [Auraticoccus monumenti]|uniref:Beta-galactosidase n=1 Tax=Auraticoccus monumenti TaxID=675864 RepID=A0A1G6X415_9ACTN|nr:glycoside hydrolase family 2 TIM barrel-domain containing protein [Auraticoccus monumenti]SDD72663.1 beta-galactosidase [Auraticoccus monumenti]